MIQTNILKKEWNPGKDKQDNAYSFSITTLVTMISTK
jgi:hypothetical protein